MTSLKWALVFVALASPKGSALAAETFSGATAAYVDWSVRACEFKSGDKTRTLVEQAKAAGEARFSDRYVKAYASKELTEANAAPPPQLEDPRVGWQFRQPHCGPRGEGGGGTCSCLVFQAVEGRGPQQPPQAEPMIIRFAAFTSLHAAA